MEQRAADPQADSRPVSDSGGSVTNGGGGEGGPDLDAAEEALLEAMLQGDGDDIEALESAMSGQEAPEPVEGAAGEGAAGEEAEAALEAIEELVAEAADADSAAEGASEESVEGSPAPDADVEAEAEPETNELEAEDAQAGTGEASESDADADAGPQAEPEPDPGSPPTAEAGPPPGMPEETFSAYVDAAAALLFASPEPLGTSRLLELLTAAERAAAAEEAAQARAAKAEAKARAEEAQGDEVDSEADASADAADDGAEAPADESAETEPTEADASTAGHAAPAESGEPAPEDPAPKRVKLGRAGVGRVLAELSQRFEAARVPIVVREIAGGWRLFTDERLGEVVARLDRSRRVERISQAALETLSIIAYRQPVTKAEIEAIRGVQAGPVLRQLVDRRLAKVAGRADQPGSPLLYGTTDEFLDRFGLASIEELPRDGELTRD